jgi:ribonuclease P protein component
MRYTVTLKKNRDFKSLYRQGKSSVSPILVLYCRRNRLGKNRIGISVGTKVGKAVVRNRVRRRIREAYRLIEHRVRPGYDLIVVARVRACASAYREIADTLETLLDRQGLLTGEEA